MKTMSINGLTLFFDAGEQDAADLVRHACEKSAQLIRECWGLGTPKDCRVYVMTSWLHFVFHSAPWPWRILLGASIPLWYPRVRKTWQFAGGWMQRFGRRPVVGVKPPRLIELADRSIGGRIFIKEDDMGKKVQHITCHELTHAFTAHLKLPMWLNEGLAMVTVDKFFERPTVRHETLETLDDSSRKPSPGRYQSLRAGDEDALVYHCVRGYWITRYLEDTQPELLRNLLTRRHRHKALESKVATAFGMSHQEFWRGIDRVLVSFFKEEELPNRN